MTTVIGAADETSEWRDREVGVRRRGAVAEPKAKF